MNRLLLLGTLASLAAAPLPVAAQRIVAAVGQQQAAARPSSRVFTPAPTPGLAAQQVTPADRAGGAMDAGPMNSTPFSSNASPVLTGDQPTRALRDSRPGDDPTAASLWRD